MRAPSVAACSEPTGVGSFDSGRDTTPRVGPGFTLPGRLSSHTRLQHLCASARLPAPSFASARPVQPTRRPRSLTRRRGAPTGTATVHHHLPLGRISFCEGRGVRKVGRRGHGISGVPYAACGEGDTEAMQTGGGSRYNQEAPTEGADASRTGDLQTGDLQTGDPRGAVQQTGDVSNRRCQQPGMSATGDVSNRPAQARRRTGVGSRTVEPINGVTVGAGRTPEPYGPERHGAARHGAKRIPGVAHALFKRSLLDPCAPVALLGGPPGPGSGL